jgi:type II secretory pathway pseudopilin PulG
MLVDAMIGVAILSIGASLLGGAWSSYARASERAIAAEGLARVIDLELERARSCPTRACLEGLAATSTTPSIDAATWARATVARAVRPADNGVVEVSITAEVPGLVRKIGATTRIWRP